MEVPVYQNERRMSTQVKAPPQSRQMGSLKVSLSSPGFVYEPYAPRAPISFWSRWFTRSGWKRTKEDFIIEMKSAYAISKLRKSGYSKNKFYQEALQMYKEINVLLAHGDKTTIRKAVTEKMYSELKNEIKTREARWSKVYWEMVEPVVKIRTMRARLVCIVKVHSFVFLQNQSFLYFLTRFGCRLALIEVTLINLSSN
ncbi:Probable 39S ribosomal protein L45, mitochondrial [Linum perenne]